MFKSSLKLLTKDDLLKLYDENATDTSNLDKQLDELKRWCQMTANKQMLSTITFNSQTTFNDQIKRVICNDDLKNALGCLKQ